MKWQERRKKAVKVVAAKWRIYVLTSLKGQCQGLNALAVSICAGQQQRISCYALSATTNILNGIRGEIMSIFDKLKLLLAVDKLWDKIMEVRNMKDPKTTIAGIVAALAMVAKLVFKQDIPDGVTEGIVAIAVFAMGFFAKDQGGN